MAFIDIMSDTDEPGQYSPRIKSVRGRVKHAEVSFLRPELQFFITNGLNRTQRTSKKKKKTGDMI
jgi:hypothetical protein